MPSEVRFTRAQRLDLVRISAAAVASTVFFTVPMFLVCPPNAPARVEDRPAQQRHIALAPSSEPVIKSQLPATSEATRSISVDANVVSVVTATEVASVTTPSLQGNATGRLRPAKPPQARARASSPAAPPSLSRRLARFFVGTGKYNIKPFPTVSTSGS